MAKELENSNVTVDSIFSELQEACNGKKSTNTALGKAITKTVKHIVHNKDFRLVTINQRLSTIPDEKIRNEYIKGLSTLSCQLIQTADKNGKSIWQKIPDSIGLIKIKIGKANFYELRGGFNLQSLQDNLDKIAIKNDKGYHYEETAKTILAIKNQPVEKLLNWQQVLDMIEKLSLTDTAKANRQKVFDLFSGKATLSYNE